MQLSPVKYGSTPPEREAIRKTLRLIRETHKDAFMANWTHGFTGIVVRFCRPQVKDALILHLAEIMDSPQDAAARAVEVMKSW